MRVSPMRNFDPLTSTRKCKKCIRMLDLSRFNQRIRKLKSGEETIQYREVCKDCSLAILHGVPETNLKCRREEYRKNPLKRLLISAKGRAKRFGMDFNISEEDLVMPEFCPLLGIPICISDNVASSNSPSVDRIDNSKGYIKGNVMIISYKANTCKNSLTLDQLRLFSHNIIGVLDKLGELREQPEVANPEPSISLNA